MPIINIDILRNISLFTLMDDHELGVLAANLDERSYLAGQIIINQHEPGNTMFVVESGKVGLYIKDKEGGRVDLGLVEPGDLFGELSLLDDAPRSASAIAIENTRVFIVDQNDLKQLVTIHPAAALDMMSVLGRRVRESNLLVSERVARNANEAMLPEMRNFGQRLSDILTRIAGDIRFVYFSLFWFVVWIAWNIGLIPFLAPFDPYPFGFLTMVVSLEAIFLSLFVLISQNRQAERDKVRNDIEYEVNLKAEVEIRQLMDRIDELQQLLLTHLSSLNAGQHIGK